MNIVCIDPSLTCTAVVINDQKFIYVSRETAFTKTNSLKKWFEKCSHLITIRDHNLPDKQEFAENEVKKISCYDEITDRIVEDILYNVRPIEDTVVYIEGYSYSSAAGPLIDLVTFGTLIRKKLVDNFSYVTVVPPSTLKLNAAELTYIPELKGKKKTFRNNLGVAGGKFKKPDMFLALVENPALTCEWVTFLRDHKDEILSNKNIPKPMEDLNDAKLMYECYKK